MKEISDDEAYYSIIALIPYGCVANYGLIAEMAGRRGHARQVGRALRNMPKQLDLPWHRVINTKGAISRRGNSESEQLQRQLLLAEGVSFKANGCVNLRQHLWQV